MYEEIKEQMVDICHKLWQKGWVAANDGNVTVKVGEGKYLATQTGVSKAFITPEKIGLIDDDFNILEAAEGFRPSSEVKMHLRCYKERPDVGAVVHAHPPVSTGFACAHLPMDDYCMIETVIGVGSIPLTPYGTPSTYEVPEAIAPYLKPRCSDSRRRPYHSILQNGNNGASGSHFSCCTSARRCKGYYSRQYRQTYRYERAIRRYRQASGLQEIPLM